MGGKKALSITSTQSGPNGHRGVRMETSGRWHFVGTVESSEDNHINSVTIRVILNGTLSQPMSKVRVTIPLEGSGLWCVPVRPQQCVAFNKLCWQETRETELRSEPNSEDSLQSHLRVFAKDILRKILEIHIRIYLYAIHVLCSIYNCDYIYYYRPGAQVHWWPAAL